MTLTIEPLAKALAAEVTGVDIRASLLEPTSAAIIEALAHHLVLVFPGEPMNDEQQIAFSRIFGPLEMTKGANPSSGTVFARQSNIDLDTGRTFPGDDRRMLYQKANMLWHSDSSFETGAVALFDLVGARIPAVGGATEFASTRAAYESLDADRQRELEGLIVEHSSIRAASLASSSRLRRQDPFTATGTNWCRTAAIAGRKSVLIGAHAKAVVGWPEDKSRALLDDLLARATRPITHTVTNGAMATSSFGTIAPSCIARRPTTGSSTAA